jgi:ketosteroid isomerase-like protein
MMRIETTRALTAVPLLALTVFAGCSSDTVDPPPAAPVNWHSFDAKVVDAGASGPTEKERALAEAYTAALGAAPPGDAGAAGAPFAQLAPLVDDEAHFSFPGLDDAHGRDPIVHAHDVLFGAFDQRKFVATRVFRTPSAQTIVWTMTGVQARDWMRLPASQKPVVIDGLSLLWTKDDGSISDVHVYFDVAAVKGQLGQAPKGLVPFTPPAPAAAAPQYVDQNGKDQDNTEVVRHALDSLENNEGAYLGALTDDVEIHTLEKPEPFKGKDEAKAYFKAMHKAIAQLDTTVLNSWGVSTYAITEYTIAGEQVGPIGWVPQQKDAVFRMHVVSVAELRDGRIARLWRYDNPGEIVNPGF